MAAEDAPSLIEYPSQFPIKVMGVNDPALEQAIVDIALQFDPAYDRATLQLRPSSGGTSDASFFIMSRASPLPQPAGPASSK